MTRVMRCYVGVMRAVVGRWGRGGDPGTLGSLRRYTRGSLFGPMILMGVFMGVWLLRGPTGSTGTTWGLVVGMAGLLGLHAHRMAGAIRNPHRTVPLRHAVPEALLASMLVCFAVTQEPQLAFLALLPGMAATTLLLGRPARQGWALAGTLACATGIATGTIVTLDESAGPEVAARTAVVSTILVMGFCWAEHTALRQWELSLELERARRAADELASTRERLRVAEDLHDMLGHALEVVAFKSELATRLNEHDAERSHAEMAEVQRLARGALHDVRQLVQGERATSLAAEFDSVRDLLSSAGIECVCRGEPGSLAESDSALLGRVLREAATNLLRHASPHSVRVTLTVDGATATLDVCNDGTVRSRQPADGEGSGLAALARRVESVGGTFRAGSGSRPRTFHVSASVPRTAVR